VVIIGMQGGIKAELNIGKLVAKRAGVIGTALRSRPVDGPGGKSEIVEQVVANVWPMLGSTAVRPVIGAWFPVEQAQQAHELLAAGDVAGKILLRVSD
jgi:NADPH:quinone reductase-like Zn-dependent oxidoreductase